MSEKVFNREVNNKMWSDTLELIQNKEILSKEKDNMVTTTVSFHQDVDLFVLEFMYAIRKQFGVKLNKREALCILLMKGLNLGVNEKLNDYDETYLNFYRKQNNLNLDNFIKDVVPPKRKTKESE